VSFILWDRLDDGEPSFDDPFRVNTWNWRTIVAAIGRLGVLPEEQLERFNDHWAGGKASREDARAIAQALRAKVIPFVASDQRLLLDGDRTTEPDDCVIYVSSEEAHKNYSTTRDVLIAFADFCERCKGFIIS
jgi:hypothetical protein